MHIKAAIDAGKHVFAEKPMAVDAPGVRMVLAAAEEAKKKDRAGKEHFFVHSKPSGVHLDLGHNGHDKGNGGDKEFERY